MRFRSQYFTEELRRIFVEDTDSEDFEGFTQSDMSGSSSIEVTGPSPGVVGAAELSPLLFVVLPRCPFATLALSLGD